jgi:hypothetical protein
MFCIDEQLELLLIQKYIFHMIEVDPLLSKIGISSSIHPPNVRYSDGEKELITPPDLVALKTKMNRMDIEEYNMETLSEQLYSIAIQQLSAMQKMLIDGMNKITHFTGNVVDAKGAKLSPEHVIEMIEQIHIDFDEEGEPRLPSLLPSPKLAEGLKQMKWTKQQEERLEQIIEEKRAKHYAKKCHRRLSFIY